MSKLISRDAVFDEIIWNADNGVIDAKAAIEAIRKLPYVELVISRSGSGLEEEKEGIINEKR